MLEALLLSLIVALGTFDYQMGTTYLFRPIVLGTLVGAVLGDLQQGIIIGATLELFFLGAVSIGAYVPPDVMVGGVLATAFAITLDGGPEVAITFALPIALLSVALGNFLVATLPLLFPFAERSAAKGEIGGVKKVHFMIGASNMLRRAIPVFFAFWLGVDAVEAFLNAIPQVLISGMGAAAGLMPALGFAMLMRMILNKQLIPFYFLGFVLTAYLNLPVLGVAILGVIIVLDKFDVLRPQNRVAAQSSAGYEEVVADDDF